MIEFVIYEQIKLNNLGAKPYIFVCVCAFLWTRKQIQILN